MQFIPNAPSKLTSARFTGRFAMVRKVQTRCLRKKHEDAHFCLALARNCKTAGVEENQLAEAAGKQYTVKVGHGDDKCKISYGPPGHFVSATARGHAGGGAHGSLVREREILAALDHDHYKDGSLTPSVMLFGGIPDHPGDSWYSGQVYVNLRDSVFDGSEPYLHAANLLQLLRREAEAEAAEREQEFSDTDQPWDAATVEPTMPTQCLSIPVAFV